ncbi:DUF3857 domain-containing protein [Chryseolinea lacunae]|uniref:DUF3857 domain-containing protein n=1 Tax=Chryseolinea lacunae TaxID=2801331 RepID=A0ABS1KP05_9BACT|nr:DUF3857 domain-containing protein [Chryseolinea lacunae]MBL0741166.1 DUF3857 domain-containing protein [Chryseolinea lacunae]
MFRTRMSVVVMLCAVTSLFAQNVKIQNVPSWVVGHTPDVKAKPSDQETSSFYYQLIDLQQNVATQEYFVHYAYQILTNEGVQAMSDLQTDFDPSYQTLAFHKMVIHRGSQVINKLQVRDLKTIQREQSMDRFLYDNALTVVINLADVRVGDVVEYAFTRKGFNPVFDGHFCDRIYFDYAIPFHKLYQRLVIPSSTQLYSKYTNGQVVPEVQKKDGLTTYVWQIENTKEPSFEADVPAWHESSRSVALSDFEYWSEVSQWAVDHFKVADAEQAKLKALVDPLFKDLEHDELLLQATRFVQDEVRYLGFEAGKNSHKPHSPLQVFEQRFGDCKDKSLLLCSILRAYDIDANPVLVNTSLRSHTSELLPASNVFDHCVVQVVDNGEAHYIDPTINNQGGDFKAIYFPTYGEGLVIRESSSNIVKMSTPTIWWSETSEEHQFDVKTIGGEVELTVRTTYNGADADVQRGNFASNSLSAIQKNYLAYYANLYPDIAVKDSLTITDDRKENKLVVQEKYTIASFWKPMENEKDKMYCEFYALTLEDFFTVPKTTKRSAPYLLSYPVNYHHSIHVNLPEPLNISPQTEEITSKYYEYRYNVLVKDRILVIQTHYKTNSDYVPAATSATYIADHEKMRGNLSYNLLYNKSLVSETGISVWAIGAAIMTLGLSAWFCIRLYRRYDPVPEWANEPGQPIGGWLVLVGIGVSITPLRMLYDFSQQLSSFESATYLGLWRIEKYALAAVIFFEMIYNVVATVFSVLMIALFYQRRSSFPRLAIIFYAASLAASFIDTTVGWIYLEESAERSALLKDLIRQVFVCAIWIPYFLVSTRVKETFVERSPDNDDDYMQGYAAAYAVPGEISTLPENLA